ncbi:MAG: hypothetical protein AB1724_12145 [Thermodesulfobacteriota bacterium]
MFKQRTIVLLVLSAVFGIFGFNAGKAMADKAVFGPKQYSRTTAAQNVYEDSFTAAEGSGELMIRNCEEGSIHRVTSARILLNDVPVFTPEDFKQNQFVLKFPLSLSQSNNLKIEISGKPGTYLVIEIRQGGVTNPPTVSLSADPETIAGGGSSTLTWTSTGADTAIIEPGVGNVDASGSLTVTPGETTLYKITVSGPGGTATTAAAVNVLYPPTVTFNAAPSEINVGDTATLSWTTTHADSVNIEPGIGPVELNGTRTVLPAQNTTYTMTASGAGGTRTASVTITVHNPLTLQITSPLDGAQVSGGTISVKGAVSHAGNKETGVAVNGIPAIISDGQFRADHVPLTDGENLLTITATDVDGHMISSSVPVHADTSGDYICLTADPVRGILPFETNLRITGSFYFTASDISYTGPGTVTFLESSYDEYRLAMDMQGVYVLTATVTDDLGYAHTNSVAVQVVEEAAIDASLRTKWEGMKAALTAGDVNRAVAFFAGSSRESFDQRFTALSSFLPGIAGGMGGIRLAEFQGERAVYDMGTVINGTTYSFQVLFILDTDGIWRIGSF